MVAGGFGTLEVTEVGTLKGHGVYDNGRWMVVFTRPFEPTGELQSHFDGETPVDVAFAMWDGAKGQRDGIKSVSAFTQLTITPEDPPRRAVSATDDWPAYTPPNSTLIVGIAFVALLLFAVVVGWVFFTWVQEESDDDE